MSKKTQVELTNSELKEINKLVSIVNKIDAEIEEKTITKESIRTSIVDTIKQLATKHELKDAEDYKLENGVLIAVGVKKTEVNEAE